MGVVQTRKAERSEAGEPPRATPFRSPSAGVTHKTATLPPHWTAYWSSESHTFGQSQRISAECPKDSWGSRATARLFPTWSLGLGWSGKQHEQADVGSAWSMQENHYLSVSPDHKWQIKQRE